MIAICALAECKIPRNFRKKHGPRSSNFLASLPDRPEPAGQSPRRPEPFSRPPYMHTEIATSCVHYIVFTIAFQFLQNSVRISGNSVKIRIFRKFLQTAVNSYKIPYRLNQCSDHYNDSMIASKSYRLSPQQRAGQLASPTELRVSALSYIKIDPVSNFLL
jgi:hypothetical protein